MFKALVDGVLNTMAELGNMTGLKKLEDRL